MAIIDAYGSSTIVQDADEVLQATNDPGNPFSKAAFSQINATPFDDQSLCDASGWLAEQAIDVEAVHSTAPDAHILYVGAQDCVNGLFTAEQNVIDNGLANVVTNSWGDDAGDLLDDAATKTAYDDLFLLADATGMTIQFSSGDDGDNFYLFGFSSADYPTESPYVTSVGGTSLQIGSNGQRTRRARLGHRPLVPVHPQHPGGARLHAWAPGRPPPRTAAAAGTRATTTRSRSTRRVSCRSRCRSANFTGARRGSFRTSRPMPTPGPAS